MIHVCPVEIGTALACVGALRYAGAKALAWASTRDREGMVAAAIGVLSMLACIIGLGL